MIDCFARPGNVASNSEARSVRPEAIARNSSSSKVSSPSESTLVFIVKGLLTHALFVHPTPLKLHFVSLGMIVRHTANHLFLSRKNTQTSLPPSLKLSLF